MDEHLVRSTDLQHMKWHRARSWRIEILCIFFLGLSVFFAPVRGFAQSQAKIQGIIMNADSMFRDSENEIMELEGNVQIVYQTQHLKCDEARVNLRTRQVELTGHVEIASEKTTVGGSAATLDYENNTGIIYNGFVQSGPVVFSGAILQKASEDEYYVAQGDYTACTNCPATWGFSGSNIRAEIGQYAYIKNSVLRVYSVPIFWLPYLMVPLKSDRQSGLLPPTFGSSTSGGAAITQTAFWAISRSSDATVGVTNYEKRGLKALGEYRYVLNENSHGNLNTAFLIDRAFKDDKNVRTFRNPDEYGKDINRWYVKYDHYYEMPNDFIQRAQINYASDLKYPKDFSEETLNYGDSAMENRVSLTKNSATHHFSVDSSYYINMLQANPLAGNSNAVHRFPEIRITQTDQKLGATQFLYDYNVDYTNFARAGQAFDNMSTCDPTTDPLGCPTKTKYVSNSGNSPTCTDQFGCTISQDGVYDPANDIIRTGQRLDLSANLYRPINLEVLDLMPSVSYRETHYRFNGIDDPSNVRRYTRLSLSAKTSLSRVFETDEKNSRADRYKHEFQPEIIATTIPWLDHPRHPFFGNGPEADGTYYYTDTLTDADINGPYGMQFDYNDRIYDRGLVTFVLNNKLVQKRWSGETASYRQVVNLKILQSYDTYQANRRNPTRDPWSDITTILDMRFDNFQTYTTANYFPKQKVTNISSRVRLNNDYGQFFQVGLAKTYTIDPTSTEVSQNTRVEDYIFGAGFVSKYINMMGKMTYNGNWQARNDNNVIKSWALVNQFKPPGDCWIINFVYYKTTAGDENYKFDFVFNFDGTPKPPLPPETLDQYGF